MRAYGPSLFLNREVMISDAKHAGGPLPEARTVTHQTRPVLEFSGREGQAFTAKAKKMGEVGSTKSSCLRLKNITYRDHPKAPAERR